MPYNPGVVNRSGEILASGILSGAHSFADVINRLAQRADEAQQLRQMLQGTDPEASPGQMDEFAMGTPEGPNQGSGEGNATEADQEKFKLQAQAVKGLRDYAAGFHGFDKNYLQTLSLPQLQGLLRGTEFKSMMAERSQRQAQAQQQFQQAQQLFPVQLAGQQNANRLTLQNLSHNDALQALGGQLGTTMTGDASTRPDINAAIFQGLRDHPGAMAAPQLDNILSVLEKYGSGSSTGTPATHNLPGGYIGFTLPGSKQLDIRPDLTAPPQPVEGGFVDAKGNFHKTPAVPDAQLKAVLHPVTKKPIEGFGMDSTGRIHDFRSQAAKLLGPDGEADSGSYEQQLGDLGLSDEQVQNAVSEAAAGGGTPAGGPPPAAQAVRLIPPPPVGHEMGGYRYNGKFPPSDKRAWDKVK